MFEIGSNVEYQKSPDIKGKVKALHFHHGYHRIICVKLDVNEVTNGSVTWFTPSELATKDDIKEYIDWLESQTVIPYLHQWTYDLITSGIVKGKDYNNTVDYGLILYLRFINKENK